MEFTPKDQIVPEKWNKEFFANCAEELNTNEGVATVILGANTPASGRNGLFVFIPPGVNPEMALIALRSAVMKMEMIVEEQVESHKSCDCEGCQERERARQERIKNDPTIN